MHHLNGIMLCAKFYKLSYGKKIDGNINFNNNKITDSTSILIANLEMNTTYGFKAASLINQDEKSEIYGNIIEIHTSGQNCSDIAPNAPNLTNTNTISSFGNTAVDLGWTATTCSSDYNIEYREENGVWLNNSNNQGSKVDY